MLNVAAFIGALAVAVAAVLWQADIKDSRGRWHVPPVATAKLHPP